MDQQFCKESEDKLNYFLHSVLDVDTSGLELVCFFNAINVK